MEPLYKVKVTCINCENEYKSPKVRPSFRVPYKKDTDFCGHYKNINPDYYVVRVCPYCGFSATENFEERITDEQRRTFYEKIGSNWNMRDLSGERTWEEALQTYQLALLCGQIKNEKPRVIAGILHHIAWMYRWKGDQEMEKRFLQFSLDAYIEVFETELNEVSNARLMYMIGELSRRLKHYSEAVRWFSRVINDQRIMDAGMIKACRDQWAATREDMLADKVELPEEMVE